MPEFVYQARDQNGTAVKGKRFANTADGLASQLYQEGIVPIHITEYRERINFWRFLRYSIGGEKVPLEELMMFSRQMYTLQKAGVPIVSAVMRLAETTRNQLLADALHGIVQQLSAGQDLAHALQQYPKVFSSLFVSIARIGESTGRLDEAFLRLTEYLELEEKTVKRVKAVVRYPSFVVIALVSAMLLINALVIPAFAKMFANYHEQLPWATQVIIGSSNFLLNHWLALLIAFLLTVVGIVYYVKTPKGKYLWHQYQLKIPVVGKIINLILLARFARTFSLIFRTGVPVNEGLNLVGSAMNNVYCAKRITVMRDNIAKGETLTQAANHTKLFSPLVIQMLAVGEQSGEVDEMLTEVAEFYEQEVDFKLKRLTDAIEPILLIGIGIMVLILALGVFLPMWDVTRLVKSGV